MQGRRRAEADCEVSIFLSKKEFLKRNARPFSNLCWYAVSLSYGFDLPEVREPWSNHSLEEVSTVQAWVGTYIDLVRV